MFKKKTVTQMTEILSFRSKMKPAYSYIISSKSCRNPSISPLSKWNSKKTKKNGTSPLKMPEKKPFVSQHSGSRIAAFCV